MSALRKLAGQTAIYGLSSIVALLVTVSGGAKSPSNPYFLRAPDFDALLPFDAGMRSALRSKGVTRVIEIHQNGTETTYSLNDKGQVIKEETTWIERGRRKVSQSCVYRYTGSGQLTSVKRSDVDDVFLDTISYDSLGRVVKYLSMMTTLRGKYKGETIWWDLTLSSPHPTHVVLKDSSEHRVCLITLNNGNEVIRIDDGQKTDSISVDIDSLGRTHQSYWYRSDTSSYRLGKKVTSEGERRTSETLWDMIWGGQQVVYRTNYYYDHTQLLYKKENEVRYQEKELFTYYDFGLPMEHVVITLQDVKVTRYQYRFN